MLLGILGEHVRHARLHAHAHEGQQALLLPVGGALELVVAQLDAALVERVGRGAAVDSVMAMSM